VYPEFGFIVALKGGVGEEVFLEYEVLVIGIIGRGFYEFLAELKAAVTHGGEDEKGDK
jgi:hypothetical protein